MSKLLYLFALSLCEVLAHIGVGLMPKCFKPNKFILVFNIPKLFESSPSSIMVILKETLFSFFLYYFDCYLVDKMRDPHLHILWWSVPKIYISILFHLFGPLTILFAVMIVSFLTLIGRSSIDACEYWT